MCFNQKAKRFPIIEGYKVDKLIGEGGNSKVYKVVCLNTNESLAAKVIRHNGAT